MSKTSITGWVAFVVLLAFIYSGGVATIFGARDREAAPPFCGAASKDLQLRTKSGSFDGTECLAWRSAIAAETQAHYTKVGFWLVALTLVATALAAGAAWRTVHVMKDTGERELRAYVGHMPNGAHFEGVAIVDENGKVVRTEPLGPVKYFDENHGQTPAYDVEMYVRVIPDLVDPPDDLDWGFAPDERKEFLSYVPPRQNIGCIVGSQRIKDKFFLYGFTEYTDAFNRRWRHRFGFSHDPDRAKMGGEAWVPHSRCNWEDDLGPTTRRLPPS